MRMITFSRKEIKQMTLSFIVVSAVFSIAFYIPFIDSVIIVGLGFILHELGHKIVAQHFKLHATFRYDLKMLVISFIASFFHFVFLAPGAVVIRGRITTKKNGIISLAGPSANLLLALLFYLIPTPISKEAVAINAWLAVFNMIPFPGFDGVGVWLWNKFIYFLTMLIGAAFIVAYHI